MIQVTRQQRDNALDALNNMWPSVPPENVAIQLRKWREDDTATMPDCGTVACFGGWCAWWPAFRAQGVVAVGPGAPSHFPSGDSVAHVLFGDYRIFYRRYHHESDSMFKGTDHELVTRRLKWLIKNSEVIAS